MSYRFLWKQIASKAISSAVARALLALNREELWDHMARTETFSREHVLRLREEVEETLKQVEARGRDERELVGRVVHELVRELLRKGGGT